ncbi:hypothetical protein [Noviherbaspirillum massiliense]|uniref:hypothetical protein n=1 Tax=Noviherbaspirillum massiliense TaxID=1465823 RepID=UPI0002DDEBBF|nr:hypothetical protein [Noviherbaspirillum massiliense]
MAPGPIAVDDKGNVYVIDNRDLRKITAQGVVTTLVATPTTILFDPNMFNLPNGLVVDTTGNIFVTDYLAAVIWKVTPNGQMSRFAAIGTGPSDPTGSGPSGIAIDALNNLYVTDLPYIQSAGGFSLVRKVTPDGKVSTLVDASTGLVNARGIAIDNAGNLFINESLLIVRVNVAGALVTYQLPASPAGGTITATGIALDTVADRLYFTDAARHTVDRLDPGGAISVIAGRAGEVGNADVTQ